MCGYLVIAMDDLDRHSVIVTNKTQLIAAIQNVAGVYEPTIIMLITGKTGLTTYKFPGGEGAMRQGHDDHIERIVRHLRKLPAAAFR